MRYIPLGYLVLLACQNTAATSLPKIQPNEASAPANARSVDNAHTLKPCTPRILNRHDPIVRPSGRVIGHSGVDVEPCAASVAIAIGRGRVLAVESSSSEEDRGGIVMINHEISSAEYAGHGIQVRTYLYAHLKNISVRVGDDVERGQVLGELWDAEDHDWIKHVHLEIISSGDVSQQDPLSDIYGCLGSSPPQTLIYPVQC